jgi:thymidylate kinase/predicted NUDIX family phosphoesterase
MTAPPVSTSTANLELAQKARDLLPILRRQARRPYIVELAGTPKAGKTTALHVLHRFLKDCGYHVQEMRERAADCPIAMKGHFFFNTWTTTTMLASMIESLESEADILLLDRGVFDALVWLESQNLDHQLSPEEYEVFRKFVLLDRWRTLTDLTFVFTVTPETSLRRENKDLLIPRTGSIMGERFLERYNQVLAQVQASVRDQFAFINIDTTEHNSPQETTHAIAAALLEHMSHWADPEIAVVPKAVAERVFGNGGIRVLPEAIEEIEQALTFQRRSALEKNDEFVGLVSAAVLRHADKMLLLRRAEKHDEKRVTFGRDVLWKGCHIERTPEGASNLLGTAAAALKARLKEDFHLARLESEPTPSFLVWNRKHTRDARHLGVFFDLEIPTPEVAQSLAGKVFKRERNRTKLGGNQFISPAVLQARVEKNDDIELESWSSEVLRHILAARSQ